MNITDELKKLASAFKGMWISHDDKNIISEWAYGYDSVEKRILTIADRIDTEHERLMEKRADRYSELRTILKERYIELPVDADEVSWNVGDCDEDGNVVTQLRLTSSGWYIIMNDKWLYRPDRHRHYYAPTVEDVLHEFICDHEEGVRDEVDLIAEYATKLQLKEN